MPSDTTSTQPLQIVPAGHALSAFFAISYVVCIGFGLVAPEQMHMYEAWAPLLPGFEWLTPRGFLFGLAGSYVYGWYTALVFVPLYRLFNRRFRSSSVSSV